MTHPDYRITGLRDYGDAPVFAILSRFGAYPRVTTYPRRLATMPLEGATIFRYQFLCENRNPCYLGRVVGKEGAPCEAPDGEGKDKSEEKFFIWNRRNPLISLESDE